MKKITLLLAFMMATTVSFAAVNDSASIGFPILDMGAGARALGMGEAFTAVADDSSAIYWNAAGLGTIRNPEAALTYTKWYMDTMFFLFLFAFPLQNGTIGADVTYMNLGEFPIRDIYGISTQSIYPYMLGGSLGYGISFGDISGGAAIKVISQTMGSASNAAFAADAGVLYKAGIFSAGLTMQNMGSADGFSLPMNAKAGIAIKPLDSTQHSLLFAVDSQYLFRDAFSLSAGVEYVYMEMLALRAGYKAGFGTIDLDGLKGVSGGIGVKISGLNVDYAIVPYGDLGVTQRVTLSLMFGSQSGEKKDLTDNSDKNNNQNPTYLHALTDLRMARGYLDKITPDEVLNGMSLSAIDEINKAIGEIKQAAIDDGKDIMDHPPIDTGLKRSDRYVKAVELLNKIYKDIKQDESNGFAKGLQKRVLRYIDKAYDIVKGITEY
jgi:hypothetical protein